MSKKSDLKTASVLAFERKLDPSDGLMYAGRWEERDDPGAWTPVAIREKSVRGTISNRLKAREQDPAKLDASIQNPNLQRVDVATLPPQADTLKLTFTLRVLPGAGIPSACNDAAYQAALTEKVRDYVRENGFDELARRYAFNLANGRFLWRNRLCAEAVEVRIRQMEDGEAVKAWSFDALQLPLRDFQPPAEAAVDLDSLAGVVAEGLSSETPVFLEIIAFARVGAGQEVYPSQELILDQGNNQKGRKSKTLYAVEDTAAVHSQKIGNALRTIDTWYPSAEESGLGPIAVEPYGSVTSRGTAYRQPKEKQDFYNLLDKWVLKGEAPAVEQQHFVIATLIRGGVFGESQD